MKLHLHNTLTGKKEEFKPLFSNEVRMYNCGPTVYDRQHIGNMRAYVFVDILKRVLEFDGYNVKQVINITDVGHMTNDADGGADTGEDKMEKSAKKLGESAQAIAKRITKEFKQDLEKLNINTDKIIFSPATAHINEQIVFVKTLEEKGYTYKTADGIYFDTSLFKDYGKLGNIDIHGLKEGARVEKNEEKKNPTDFALWKFSAKGEKRQQEWKSPWGTGFPGWHIECSAMARSLLGAQIDIHTGGIDHIPIHHNNEIAQTEALTGKRFANYWLHNAFITIDGKKISKSIGNVIYLYQITERGFSPLAYRYLLLTGHYASPINFTWEALEASNTALKRLCGYIAGELTTKNGEVDTVYREKFNAYINNDLDTPRAMALLWRLVKDVNVSKENKRATFLEFDKVLGLRLKEATKGRKINVELPTVLQKLLAQRQEARKAKDFTKSDKLRDKIRKLGYEIKDTNAESVLLKLE